MTAKHLFRALPPKQIAQLSRLSRLLGMCFVVLFSFSTVKSQTTIYAQPFSGTLAASGWVSNNLTAPWGNGSLFGISNIWQVSDLESGMSANTCGSSSMGDQSLYMGATGFGSGAAYLSDVNTNRRISSAAISTVGYTGVVAEFDFIGNGEGTNDRSYFVYSIDGGTTWVVPTGAPTSSTPAMGTGGSINNLKSQICGSGQGRWTHVVWNMPVTCEGIASLRVGFVWQSNNNSAGSDPSFAVDDVVVSGTLTPAPIELISFTAKYNTERKVELKWITASEINNDYFSVERSSDAVNFYNIGNLPGAGNSSQMLTYNTIDDNPISGISYYRLKQTDFNGDFKYSEIEVVQSEKEDFEIIGCYVRNEQLELIFHSSVETSFVLELYSIEGRKMYFMNGQFINPEKKIAIPISTFSNGIYLLKAYTGDKIITRKIKL